MPVPPNDPNALRHTRAMPPFCPRTIARHALVAAVLNTVLALAITVSGDQPFAANLLYSQLIGMTIWALIDGGRFLLSGDGWPGAPKMAAVVLVAVLTGYFGGSALGDLLLGREPLQGFSRFPKAMTGFLLMSLAAGVAGAYFFTTRAMLANARLANEEALRQASEAKLKLLETQLEPHMLFNTLANLRALIGIDPPRAQVMLDHMNGYLRATLSGSRATTHPLSAEFARLDDYLALMAVRMGPRLGCTLDLPRGAARPARAAAAAAAAGGKRHPPRAGAPGGRRPHHGARASRTAVACCWRWRTPASASMRPCPRPTPPTAASAWRRCASAWPPRTRAAAASS